MYRPASRANSSPDRTAAGVGVRTTTALAARLPAPLGLRLPTAQTSHHANYGNIAAPDRRADRDRGGPHSPDVGLDGDRGKESRAFPTRRAAGRTAVVAH